jgi:hypothetical protein
MDYNAKYLKYKTKYLNLKYAQMGGGLKNAVDCNNLELEVDKIDSEYNDLLKTVELNKIIFSKNPDDKIQKTIDNDFKNYETKRDEYIEVSDKFLKHCTETIN